MKILKNKKIKYEAIDTEVKNLLELSELLLVEEDTELEKELLRNTENLRQSLEKLEIETLLSRKI